MEREVGGGEEGRTTMREIKGGRVTPLGSPSEFESTTSR